MLVAPLVVEERVLIPVDPPEFGVPGVLDSMLFSAHTCFFQHSHRSHIVGVAASHDPPKTEPVECCGKKATGQVGAESPSREIGLKHVAHDTVRALGHAWLPHAVNEVEEPQADNLAIKLGDARKIRVTGRNGEPLLPKRHRLDAGAQHETIDDRVVSQRKNVREVV
jgi:hypothetical protein